MLSEIKEPRGQKRLFDEVHAPEEEELLHQDAQADSFDRNAPHEALAWFYFNENMGMSYPHRSKDRHTKWVDSPRLPYGLESYPQTVYDTRGQTKIIREDSRVLAILDFQTLFPEN